MYTADYLLDKLNWLLLKHGKIQTKLIDSEPNFPTRKCFIRAFGSVENACKIIGYDEYQKHSFTIQDAQKVLDERNGHFDLLTFNGMGNKASIRCRECGYIDNIIPDSLLRNKTDKHFGCKNCNRMDFIDKLLSNNLEFIEYLGNGKCKVKCLLCGAIIDGWESNLVRPEYNCQLCNPKIKTEKIIKHKNKYSKITADRAEFLSHLESVVTEGSLMWFYCLGIFMSDGHFTTKNQRLKFWINNKDSDVVDEIAKFLRCPSLRYKKLAGIDFCGGHVFHSLINKYHISDQKTYNPCDISSIKNQQLIAFIVGFIDGDGCILQRSDNCHMKITIKVHTNWKDNLQYMSNGLYEYFNIHNAPSVCNVKQNDRTYATISWCNEVVVHGLSNFIKQNNIPCLMRKWNKL